MKKRDYILLILTGYIIGTVITAVVTISINDRNRKILYILLFIISYGSKRLIKHKFSDFINRLNYFDIFSFVTSFLKGKDDVKEPEIKTTIYDKKIHITYTHQGKIKYFLLPYQKDEGNILNNKVVYLINQDKTEIDVTQISGVQYPNAKEIGGICYRVVDTVTDEEIECHNPYLI